MRILASADDNGSLKGMMNFTCPFTSSILTKMLEIVCPRGTDTSSQTAPQPEKIEIFNDEGLRNRVQKLIVVTIKGEQVVVTARANGQIKFYKSETYELINSVSNALETSTKDQFISLIFAFDVIYTASEQGKITAIDIKTISNEKISTQTTTVKGPLSAFVSHPRQEGLFAFGGKENDVKLVRLYEKGSSIFKDNKVDSRILFQGKNVKNDRLDLRVPIWITNILFIDLDEHTESTWYFITTTGYGQVRKYDTSHGRKPVLDKKLSDKPLIRVAITPKEDEIICADTHNITALFNTEKGSLIAKYKGSVGAVQSLYSHLTGKNGLLVSGALDRYVRVFDINTREQVAKIYVGSKISAVWLLDDQNTDAEDIKAKEEQKAKKTRKKAAPEEEENEDEVWDQLNQLEKKTTKKRKT